MLFLDVFLLLFGASHVFINVAGSKTVHIFGQGISKIFNIMNMRFGINERVTHRGYANVPQRSEPEKIVHIVLRFELDNVSVSEAY